MPSFDWYQATLTDQQPDEVLAVLREFFPRTDIKRGRLLYGYKEAFDLVRGDHRIVSLMWGLHSSPDPHIQFTGSDAKEGASLCRKLWPNHRVSRVDSAMDWYSTGAWDELSSLALEIAHKHNLKVQHVGDFLRGENGRTLYIGSKSSPVFVCLYEKGKQPGMELLGEPHWVRLEVRVRPKSSAKAQCATITPPEVFGCALWTKELYQRLTGSSIARHQVGTQYEPTDDDRAFAALVKQYGPLVVRLCGAMGAKAFAKKLLDGVGWDCPF